ncbi:unnamed protein product [Cuscuta europaea]|uniref:S-protein homolog n=1 Tax=Cuscuta europaea TaxID=41803 RepID=A0A9P0ZK06_CUSEU|nr:unnamed protein product [Cuscuta europaea]
MSWPPRKPNFYSSSIVLLLCFAITITDLQGVSARNKKKVVRIVDMIPTYNPVQPPRILYLHCQSHSDDLGVWDLTENKGYQFYFRTNFWGTTLFWCTFTWGKKDQSIAVYDDKDSSCDGERYCNWHLKTDGLYFAKGEFPSESDFTKKADWKDI